MIERLYVHNFRCLENFTLDFAGQHSALLIGKNGAGKSTVLHALQVLQSICRGPNRVRDVIRAKDFARFDKSQPMRFEIDAVLELGRFKYTVSFEWPTDFYEARIVEETLLKDGVSVFTRRQAQVQTVGGAEFRLDWHVFALPVINEKPPERSIQDVKAFFATMILLAPIPQMMEGFSEEPATELDRHGLNYASCLRAMLQRKPKAYGEFESFVRNVLPDFSSIENVDRGKEGGSQLIVTFDQQNPHQTLPLDFDVLSDGEKCFMLSAYIAAANAVRARTDPPVVCVWDEPDNHLSLSEVGHFIAAMRKMTNRGGQFIATTHHPETIRKFSDDNTFVLVRKSHLEPTVVKPLSAFSYTGDLIHALARDEIIG
ncbi:MAG: AAA family ATPase [Phycisphaerales bacterium]|nr:AAA family ATPase [Phycisphaerales bacterium]